MATLASTQASDIEIFKILFPLAYPSHLHRRKDLIGYVKDGVVAIETLLEKALSVQGRLKRNSVHGEDFTDGSDSKKAIIQYTVETKKRKGRSTELYEAHRFRAKVSNITTKHGLLRVFVYDPFNKKCTYFKIPRTAYCNLKSIAIEFKSNGDLAKRSKWAKYKVDTFKLLAR